MNFDHDYEKHLLKIRTMLFDTLEANPDMPYVDRIWDTIGMPEAIAFCVYDVLKQYSPNLKYPESME